MLLEMLMLILILQQYVNLWNRAAFLAVLSVLTLYPCLI